jgi:hypothetical protein
VIKNIQSQLSMGVSICLDMVSIETLDLDIVKEWVSTVEKISTASKSYSRQLRYLDRDRDFSISSRQQCLDQKVSIEIEKFVEIWNFRRFLTVCLDLDREVRGFLYFLVEISQSVEISQQSRLRLDKSQLRLDKSRKSWRVSTNLDNLVASRQSRQKSQRVKVSTEKNLDRQKKKVDLDRRENLDNLKKLVSTRRTFSISISIGLDCRDPQP